MDRREDDAVDPSADGVGGVAGGPRRVRRLRVVACPPGDPSGGGAEHRRMVASDRCPSIMESTSVVRKETRGPSTAIPPLALRIPPRTGAGVRRERDVRAGG